MSEEATSQEPPTEATCIVEAGPIRLELRDCLEGMAELPDASVDLAIADPAYGAASSRPFSLDRGHGLPGFGGSWTQGSEMWDSFDNKDRFGFIIAWLSELQRLVKPTGSIWVHATYHNSGFVNVACQLLGLEIINEVVWFKRNAFPNLAGRRLTASHETLIWAHTGSPRNRQYRFNYEVVRKRSYGEDGIKREGRQLRTVWDIPNNKRREELQFGKHPTQKPLRLTERLFDVAGTPGGTVLVPFAGSGTELVAALRYGMGAIGYEIDPQFFGLAASRVDHEARHSRLPMTEHADA